MNFEYTKCYNCTGANMHMMCGFPQAGCILCQTYGDGAGNLLKEYRYRTVTITADDYKGDPKTHTFVPPTYSCLTCKDTKVYHYQIWDKDLEDECSDHGAHNMPNANVACHKCLPTEHETEYEAAKKNYFNNKK